MARIPTYNQSKGRSVSSFTGKKNNVITIKGSPIFINGRLEMLPERDSKKTTTSLANEPKKREKNWILSGWSIDIYHICSYEHLIKTIVFYNMDPDVYIALLPQTGMAAQGKRRLLIIPKKGESTPNDNLVKIANTALVVKEINSFERGKKKEEVLKILIDSNKVKRPYWEKTDGLDYAPVSEGKNNVEMRILGVLQRYYDFLGYQKQKAIEAKKKQD